MSSGIMVLGKNCLGIEHSPKTAFLIDGDAYFRAFRQSVMNAEHSVFILGWDIDSRVRLSRGADEDGRPAELYPFLQDATQRKPGLEIFILAWDFSMIFAMEREWLPLFRFNWKREPRIHFHLDDAHPLGSSHHQKVVVIDDSVAFAGGLDLTKRRWDTTKHLACDERRTDPDGKPYGPFHDCQMMVSGPAAAALGKLARNRWTAATGKTISVPDKKKSDCWPETITPDLLDTKVSISRTFPEFKDNREIREIENLFVDSIRAAKNQIYIENQYLSSKTVGEALRSRLAEISGPDILVIMPRKAGGWIEQTTMDVARARLLRTLFAADKYNRLGIYYPVARTCSDSNGKDNNGVEREVKRTEIYVHAKLMIVDDCFVHIGSANLSNRSMGLDTECDLAVEYVEGQQGFTTKSDKQAIPGLRNRLLCEHLKIHENELQAAIEKEGSLNRAVALLSRQGGLQKPDWEVDEELDRQVPQTAIIDPEHPMNPGELIDMFLPPDAKKSIYSRTIKFITIFSVLIVIFIGAQFSQPARFWNVERLTGWFDAYNALPCSIGLSFVFFSLGATTGLPVTILIAAAAALHHPIGAFFISILGITVSSAASFAIGRYMRRSTIRLIAGSRLNKLSRNLARRSIVAMAAVRVIPVAPFFTFNIVAGSSRVRFRDFYLGTVLGMTPGVLVMSFFISSFFHALRDPTPLKAATAAFFFFAVSAVALLLTHYLGEKTQK